MKVFLRLFTFKEEKRTSRCEYCYEDTTAAINEISQQSVLYTASEVGQHALVRYTAADTRA